jgi:hypothetical protein
MRGNGCCETYCYRRDVGKVSGNAWSIDHIVKRKLIDKWADLKEKGQRLYIAHEHTLRGCLEC